MFIELHTLHTNEPMLISCLQIVSVITNQMGEVCIYCTDDVGDDCGWRVSESYVTVATLIAQATRVVTG